MQIQVNDANKIKESIKNFLDNDDLLKEIEHDIRKSNTNVSTLKKLLQEQFKEILNESTTKSKESSDEIVDETIKNLLVDNDNSALKSKITNNDKKSVRII